jgi:membrane complex biogenesis BtpA family protein
VADQGILQGEAHEILRDRRLLGSAVRIFADVAVKHSAPLGQRVLSDEVEDTLRRGHADAVIVSGTGTGKTTSLEDLKRAKAAAGRAPIYAGSGVDQERAAEVLRVADGIIVGTALKRDRVTAHPVEIELARRFVKAARCA